MYSFFGDYEKHDFVLMVSLALSVLREKKINIITDNVTHYQHLGGDFLGVVINSHEQCELVIYDTSKVVQGTENVVLCTNHTKNSIESIRSVYGKLEIQGFVVCDQESRTAEDLIATFTNDSKVITYPYSTSRMSDVIFEGRFDFKKIDSGFIKSVSKFLLDFAGESKADVKALWTYLGKRG